MSEKARSQGHWRGAGVVERGGLESRCDGAAGEAPQDAAGHRSGPPSGGFWALALLAVLRWTMTRTAWLSAASSAVQPTSPKTSSKFLLFIALPLVALEKFMDIARKSVVACGIPSIVQILSVAQAMRRSDATMDGFEVDDRPILAPPVPVDDVTKERLATALSAIIAGATPEDLVDYLEQGFPASVTDALERPGERDEMYAHLDLLLGILQAPAEG
jgi:hypothetical protein